MVTLASHTWAILPVALTALAAELKSGTAATTAVAAARPRNSVTSIGAIAVVPLVGVLSPGGDWGSGTSLTEFTRTINGLAADPSVRQIVLAVDSPGGTVAGTIEAANAVYLARQRKPLTAVATSLMASAAYWIGSQATEIVASPSADVGSIGVVTVHEDVNRALDAAGVRVTVMSAGRRKAEGNSYEPLSNDARAHIQSRLDEMYGAFTRAVARGRRVPVETVRTGFGEGRVYGARAALIEGMVDRIDTLDATLARLSRPGAAPSPARATASVAMQRLKFRLATA